MELAVTDVLQGATRTDGQLVGETGRRQPSAAGVPKQVVLQTRRHGRPAIIQQVVQQAIFDVVDDETVLDRDQAQTLGQHDAELHCVKLDCPAGKTERSHAIG